MIILYPIDLRIIVGISLLQPGPPKYVSLATPLLTEREVVEHNFKDIDVVEGAAIVARFFTKRRVNLKAVASTLKSAWKTELSFEVRDLGESKAIFLFEDETDMVRVLNNSPWSFDKYLLAVHKLEKDEQIQNISFDKASFWVQFHDLPAKRMTREVG